MSEREKIAVKIPTIKVPLLVNSKCPALKQTGKWTFKKKGETYTVEVSSCTLEVLCFIHFAVFVVSLRNWFLMYFQIGFINFQTLTDKDALALALALVGKNKFALAFL